MSDVMVIPESKEIQKGMFDLSERALNLTVVDNDTYAAAGGLFKAHKEMEKEIKTFFEPHKKDAHKAWKNLCNAETAELAKLKPGMNHLNREMTKWKQEQDRKRREEEARLREKARKQAEEEQLRAAEEAEARGDKDEAEAIINEEPFIPPPVVKDDTPKVQGVAFRTTWKFRVINLAKVPDEYKMADEKKIGAVVRALKEKTNIPGIEIYSEQSAGGSK